MKKSLLWILPLSLSLVACGPAVENEDVIVDVDSLEAAPDDKSDQPNISFTEFSDDIGTTGQTKTRKVFMTKSSYKAFFGHNPPTSVDFTKHGVVFYSAGSKPTGGYDVSVERIRLSNTGLTLKVTTSLVSPGAGCFVTQAFTKPHTLVKFKKPSPRPTYVNFYSNDSVNDCTPEPLGCEAVLCAPGTQCNDADGTASCDPIPGWCNSAVDCVKVDSYCGGCECIAIRAGETGPICNNPVNCFVQPCAVESRALACVNNACALQ